MAVCIKDNGSMEKNGDKVNTIILMENVMKDNGKFLNFYIQIFIYKHKTKKKYYIFNNIYVIN